MPNIRPRIFPALVACHSALYAAADLLWNLVPNDAWREFWATIWAVTLLPALWAGYDLGLPLVQPLNSGIFVPVLEPNTAGYVFCIAFWCALYAPLSWWALPMSLKAAGGVHRRLSTALAKTAW